MKVISPKRTKRVSYRELWGPESHRWRGPSDLMYENGTYIDRAFTRNDMNIDEDPDKLFPGRDPSRVKLGWTGALYLDVYVSVTAVKNPPVDPNNDHVFLLIELLCNNFMSWTTYVQSAVASGEGFITLKGIAIDPTHKPAYQPLTQDFAEKYEHIDTYTGAYNGNTSRKTTSNTYQNNQAGAFSQMKSLLGFANTQLICLAGYNNRLTALTSGVSVGGYGGQMTPDSVPNYIDWSRTPGISGSPAAQNNGWQYSFYYELLPEMFDEFGNLLPEYDRLPVYLVERTAYRENTETSTVKVLVSSRNLFADLKISDSDNWFDYIPWGVYNGAWETCNELPHTLSVFSGVESESIWDTDTVRNNLVSTGTSDGFRVVENDWAISPITPDEEQE